MEFYKVLLEKDAMMERTMAVTVERQMVRLIAPRVVSALRHFAEIR
jgi:hypothetical protein